LRTGALLAAAPVLGATRPAAAQDQLRAPADRGALLRPRRRGGHRGPARRVPQGLPQDQATSPSTISTGTGAPWSCGTWARIRWPRARRSIWPSSPVTACCWRR